MDRQFLYGIHLLINLYALVVEARRRGQGGTKRTDKNNDNDEEEKEVDYNAELSKYDWRAFTAFVISFIVCLLILLRYMHKHGQLAALRQLCVKLFGRKSSDARPVPMKPRFHHVGAVRKSNNTTQYPICAPTNISSSNPEEQSVSSPSNTTGTANANSAKHRQTIDNESTTVDTMPKTHQSTYSAPVTNGRVPNGQVVRWARGI